MPVYEFMCPKGHVSEDLVRVDTKSITCMPCHLEAIATKSSWFTAPVVATRILSPTRTTFEFADNRRHKDWEKTP